MNFVDANNIPYTPSKFLSYDDVLLMPQPSDLISRNDKRISLTTRITSGVNLNGPILSANMDTVTEADMVKVMGEQGCMGILHRYYKDPAKFTKDCQEIIDLYGTVAFSIGISPADGEIVDHVLSLGPKSPPIVCVDVAHGHMQINLTFLKELRRRFGDRIQIMAGNVCTPHGVAELIQTGINAVKIGVGNGSHCTTRLVTGHGIPQLTAIMWARHTITGLKSNCTLVADGGIRDSGDIIKAMAAGADTVMVGRLFGATQEAPSVNIIPQDKAQIKEYRGQSSESFMSDIGKSGVAPEGVSQMLPVTGSAKDVLSNLLAGVRSGLTYTGARNFSELYKKAVFIEIGHNSLIEGRPHGKTNN